jgi:hypothetical protein
VAQNYHQYQRRKTAVIIELMIFREGLEQRRETLTPLRYDWVRKLGAKKDIGGAKARREL